MVELEEVSLPEYHRGPGIISWMEGPRGKWLHRWARCALTTTREGVLYVRRCRSRTSHVSSMNLASKRTTVLS